VARHPDSIAGRPQTVFEAVRASSRRHILAEGPVWVAATSTILWVDVEAGSVFGGHLDADRVEESWKLDFEGRVGAAVPGVGGSLLVATADRVVVVPPNGERLDGPILVPAGRQSRSNDAACDPAGRFLVGTMALDDREGGESLYRVEEDGSLTTIDSDLTLSNGMGWSPDGRLFYSTDTEPEGVIWVRNYDAETGVVGARREHLRVENGFPDGLCVDSRGYLWVAIWGAGEVRSFAPDGELVAAVNVPCPHPSSVAFVGDDLDILLITTASRDLSEADLAKYPDAGRLFLARVGVSGIPTFPWSESWRDSLVGERQ
jgi:sugar lactone lactonase YvrE